MHYKVVRRKVTGAFECGLGNAEFVPSSSAPLASRTPGGAGGACGA
ncbi:hypothetical protein [Streptomyces sp. NPDC001657]